MRLTRTAGFTLIELLIAMTIVGVLSILLFRTMGDMMRAHARVQNEKSLNQELINLQTTLNTLSEQYPHLDMEKYKGNSSNLTGVIGTKGYTPNLYLTNNQSGYLHIYSTGSCPEYTCFLEATITTQQPNNPPPNNPIILQLTNTGHSTIHDIVFKVLPTHYYTTDTIYDLEYDNISAEGFWIFGTIRGTEKKSQGSSSYILQHFTNLQ